MCAGVLQFDLGAVPELLLPCELLADLLMADSQLGLGGFIAGVELQDFLEVGPCRVNVIHCQVGLSVVAKALLIVAVQLLLWSRLGFQGMYLQQDDPF